MKTIQKINKHFRQIKNGGILVIIKKFKSLILLFLQVPVYLISIPTIILIRLIRPWFLIRWHGINSARIGHFASETELYCCEIDYGINKPNQNYVDLFYLSKKIVSNKQLERMWRRKIKILPRFLIYPLFNFNRILDNFFKGGNFHEIGTNTNSDRDVHNLLEKYSSHINFTEEEEEKGKQILNRFDININKFVCLNVRDSAYLDRHKKHSNQDWTYHNFRDGDIDLYIPAAEELVKRGYHVFRMGAKVLKKIKSTNSKIIDYANSEMRSEFMDIYLGAKCSFCITTGNGFDEIPRIFRKPIAWVYVPIGNFLTNNKKDLLITKNHINKNNNNKLSLSEIFSFNVAFVEKTEEFKNNNVKLEDNSPKEVRDLVIEMDERLNGSWKETEQDLSLQEKFWKIFKENIKKQNLDKPIHGTIKAKIGSRYLRENQDWIR
jgi:putative glycosyltransferase (TIGR04372 family)